MPEPKLVESVARATPFRPTRDECAAPASPIIDRIAEALFEADATIHDFKIAWCDVGDYRRFCYRMRAREALTAMREPNDLMIEVGEEEILVARQKQAAISVADIYRAMVQAALAATDEGGRG